MLGLEAGLCCLSLLAILGSETVHLPATTEYDNSGRSYFAQVNDELSPGCVVQPRTTEQVATAIKIISTLASGLNLFVGDHQTQCRFAIRSGGHHTNKGASNIQSGVTLDLGGLNGIDISNEGVSKVGPGATWDQVYEKLEPHNLTVAGGRTAGVGVGGLVTGGGISYFAPRYGWTCDTVINFEVVLADGTIVNANERENPDLLWALRGGSNNFGVVTRIDLKTFHLDGLWGGMLLTDHSDVNERLQAYVDFNDPERYDEFASVWMALIWLDGQGPMIMHAIEYTKPAENPPVFKPFTSRPSQFDTLRFASPAELAHETAELQPKSVRQRESQVTHACTLPMLQALLNRWTEGKALLSEIPSATNWAVIMEAMPPAWYNRGGDSNALGLTGRSGSLVVTLLVLSWSDPRDDEKADALVRKVYDDVVADAKRLGAYDNFVYLNNAAPWQDVMGSYGEKNVGKLRGIRRKYDPKDLFTKNVPGGFKIRATDRLPVSEVEGGREGRDEL